MMSFKLIPASKWQMCLLALITLAVSVPPVQPATRFVNHLLIDENLPASLASTLPVACSHATDLGKQPFAPPCGGIRARAV